MILTILDFTNGSFWMALTIPQCRLGDYVERPRNNFAQLFLDLTAEEVGQLNGGN